ncbi:MAG: CoA-binding protein [Planctomycetota bacterium]
MNDMQDRIQDFLDGQPFAVVGASPRRHKYGNKVLRAYAQHGRPVFPVNPREAEIEGLTAYPDLAALPETPHGVSFITPPAATEAVVDQALELGITRLWMQPGAEHPGAVERARAAGANVIAGDACVLVVLGFDDSAGAERVFDR